MDTYWSKRLFKSTFSLTHISHSQMSLSYSTLKCIVSDWLLSLLVRMHLIQVYQSFSVFFFMGLNICFILYMFHTIHIRKPNKTLYLPPGAPGGGGGGGGAMALGGGGTGGRDGGGGWAGAALGGGGGGKLFSPDEALEEPAIRSNINFYLNLWLKITFRKC